jgi:hypothetical protein
MSSLDTITSSYPGHPDFCKGRQAVPSSTLNSCGEEIREYEHRNGHVENLLLAAASKMNGRSDNEPYFDISLRHPTRRRS